MMAWRVDYVPDFRFHDEEREFANGEFTKDTIESASASMPEMQIDPKKVSLHISYNNVRRVTHLNHPPKLWQKPTQALIHEDLEESSSSSSSKNTGGSADLGCSPMSWEKNDRGSDS